MVSQRQRGAQCPLMVDAVEKSVGSSPRAFSSKSPKTALNNISDLAWQQTRQMRSGSRDFAPTGLFQQYRWKADH
jgi:hypothetical protein